MSEQRLNGGLKELRSTLRTFLVEELPGCRPDTIRSLTELARHRLLRPGDPIYRQGEAVPLTLILRGYGVAQRTTSTGQLLMSGVAPAGSLFGWSGLHASPSSIELIAVSDCDVVQWPGREIRGLAAADPALALAAIDSMADSLHATIELIEGFLHQDARQRVLRILARHRDLFFAEPAVLDRTHLPGLVGTSGEMTRRVLRQLEGEGTLVRVGRAGMRLLKPERLDARTA
ncbi:MAG TPA: Crp/Fnr family transcriptional regulator [Candidatus Limnocylindrales bacterium]|nr:Crp/Fnr family transcriptional regulator [Candidatus Limnocylindrales bacterium]